ncbi:MAG: DNA-processing protein DprA [Prevotellaceae bacterium]|nr:DNA-processing protein DprA [Prevotellaceae bacterium]MDY3366419.1 DNA-processing protein DprA [Prevotella sp.]
MNSQETLNAIALTRLNYFNLSGLVQLYQLMGSATEVVQHRHKVRDIIPHASDRLVEALKGMDEHLRRAEAEMAYNQEHGIQTFCLNDDNYPQRLKECDDAPLVLFYKGNAPLNQERAINIIGTRHCTTYGIDLIRRFVQDLKTLCPQVLIISGLAYGVDINAHRQALLNGYPTVGVLAHGLDTLYPSLHRQTAEEMLHQGGLITEFLTQTNADKMNFVRRNRIVAGMSDACIVVESAARGGGLITAGIAQSYHRDVFAFPGAVGAKCSEGCNQLIRDNKASLITSAADFVKAMGWEEDALRQQARSKGIDRQLFPMLSPQEQQVVDVLQQYNDVPINVLTVKTNIPIATLTSLLFQLEMKGVVKMLAGGVYHLLH